jgi:hypothetical protein
MYNMFLSFMFGLLIGTGVYACMEIYHIESFIIPLWSFVIICLFIYHQFAKTGQGEPK